MDEIGIYAYNVLKEYHTGLLLNPEYQYVTDYDDKNKIWIYLKCIFQDDDYDPLDGTLHHISQLSNYIVYDVNSKKFSLEINHEIMEIDVYHNDDMANNEKIFVIDYLISFSSDFGKLDLQYIKKHLKHTCENDGWKLLYKKYKKALKKRIWQLKDDLLTLKSELLFDLPSGQKKQRVYGVEYIIILNELGMLDKTLTKEKRSEIANTLLTTQNHEIFNYINVKEYALSTLLTYIKNQDSANKKDIVKGSKLDKIIMELRNKCN